MTFFWHLTNKSAHLFIALILHFQPTLLLIGRWSKKGAWNVLSLWCILYISHFQVFCTLRKMWNFVTTSLYRKKLHQLDRISTFLPYKLNKLKKKKKNISAAANFIFKISSQSAKEYVIVLSYCYIFA